MAASSSSAATDATYPIRLQGVPPPPLTKAGKPSKSKSAAKPQPQQRHLVQIAPSQTTVPQLRLDAYRLFGASLEHYDVELRVGFPPKLIGVGEGEDEDEETLVKDFVGRNESVTVRFVPSGGPKKSKANIRTSGSGIVGVGGGAGGVGGGSAARPAPKKSARKTTASAAAGKKRSRPAASAAADDSDEYDPNADGADDGSDDGGNGNGNHGQDTAANANGGRKSKRAASAAATAAMPAIIREQDRLMAQQQQGSKKTKAAKKKKGTSPAAGSSKSNDHNNNLAAARAAAAEKRAAAAAVRKMAAMPGRRLGDGSDVAPTRAAAAAATRKKKGGRGTNLFGNMSSEDEVSYALMGSMAGGAGGGVGGAGGGGKIGKVLRTAMKGAVGKSYEASRAVVRVDAVRAGKFRIVAKSDAASVGAGAGASAGGGSGTASASHVGMYVARYSKGVEGRGEYEEDVEIIALEALRAVVAAVHADHSDDDDDLEAAGGGGGGSGSGREMLRPASMAQLSPRVFWSLAHHYPGNSTEDALRALLPNLDWSFLDGRSRMLSEKARENRRQEKVARGEIADEDDEGAGGDDGGIEAIEAVEKAMEDMAEHDRSNARERAARAALARFDGDSPSKVSANVAAPTDKTGLSGSIQPEIWKLVTPTDEDEDELAECIREGFASSEGGAYEATDSDIKAWTVALMNQCSVHNWRELANVSEGSSIASLMGVATPDQDRPTASDIDGWIEAARGRSVEEIAMEIVDGNEEAYVALRDAASAGTPKDLFAWRAMTDMLLEEIQGYEGADVSGVTEADLKRWCARAGIALSEADWLIWYATPSA